MQFPAALKKRRYLLALATINNWVSANSGNNSVEIPLLLAGIIFQWRSENNGSIIGDFADPIKHTSKTIIIIVAEQKPKSSNVSTLAKQRN